MKKRFFYMGLIVLLAGFALTPLIIGTTPEAIASPDCGTACDDPAKKGHTENKADDLDSLFEDDDHDDHAGDGHGALDGLICGEHDVPEAVCALCQGSQLGELQPGQGMKVRLAAPDVAAKAGVQLTRPQQVTFAAGVDIPGRVAFDRKQLATITPLASGVIRRVHVLPGSNVERGDVLAEIAMPAVAGLKAEFTAALARQAQSESTYQREKDLLERGISSRQEFQQAESDYLASRSATGQYRQQLLNYGLSGNDIDRLTRSPDAGGVVSLRAPFAGVVTDVQTATGEAVSAGSRLFTVADLDSLWVELAIPETLIYLAETGAAIQARFDGLPGRVFTGQLFQVGVMVDERTRTLSALAEVQNPEKRLKVGMFGSVRILAGDDTESLAIPSDAVQSIDGSPFVFIREDADLFEIRRVETGSNQDGLVVVLAGLNSGDQVVSGQGFALKSEVLKARLGASCADH